VARAGGEQAGLAELLRQPGLWRAGERPAGHPARASGHRGLDALLPGGGWPLGALTEILAAHRGIGEISLLLLPVLTALSAQGRCSLWIDPPAVPYAPALAGRGLDPASVVVVRTGGGAGRCWAAEQALRSAACGAVLLWLGQGGGGMHALRRLQLAAEQGASLGFLLRPASAAGWPSPAALRLAIAPRGAGQLTVRVLRCRGGWVPDRALCLAR